MCWHCCSRTPHHAFPIQSLILSIKIFRLFFHLVIISDGRSICAQACLSDGKWMCCICMSEWVNVCMACVCDKIIHATINSNINSNRPRNETRLHYRRENFPAWSAAHQIRKSGHRSHPHRARSVQNWKHIFGDWYDSIDFSFFLHLRFEDVGYGFPVETFVKTFNILLTLFIALWASFLSSILSTLATCLHRIRWGPNSCMHSYGQGLSS